MGRTAGEVTELSGESVPTPTPAFSAAKLQCDPFFTDWTVYDSVHAYGEPVIPGQSYEIALVASGCEMFDYALSDPLEVKTSPWGDFVGDVGACQTAGHGYVDCWTAPEDFVGFTDIGAMVDKFLNVPGAPQKSRADIMPCKPDLRIDFTDIPAVVDAFLVLPYPCPSVDPCG